jgi:intein/homing endonuclease/MoaA/NifB/PqqE/SkfB family radical SAM enzyme
MKNKYSNLKIVDYPEKIQSFRDNKLTEPIYVRIKPTNRCPHNCDWCVYVEDFSGMHEKCNKIDEIPTEKLLEIVNDLADIGTKAMVFSVRGDEQIIIHNGNEIKPIEIKELTLGEGYSFGEKNGYMLNGDIINIIKHPANSKLLKITTTGGYTITLTPSHSSIIYDGEKLINKDASKLLLGDMMASPLFIPTKHIDYGYNKSFYRLLGYFVAEGSYEEASIVFSLGTNDFEKRISDDIQYIAEDMGFNSSSYNKGNKTSVHIFSKNIVSIFKKIVKDKCRQKHIPDMVFNADEDYKFEFLYGLYAGDGCVRFNKKRGRCVLNLKTSSKKLAEQTVLLWRTLGEFVSINYGINGKRYIEGRELPETDYYSIDLSGFRILQYYFIRRLFHEKGIYPDSMHTKYSFVRKESKISKNKYNDFALLKIIKIEELDNDIEEVVYDIEIKDLHNFICGSGMLLTHNTGGGEPLGHPGIKEALELCYTRDIKFGVITNGQLLNNEMAEYLIDASWVRLSMDYWDENSFAISRKVHKKFFNQIKKNISYLAEIKSPDCDLEVNFVVTEENCDDLFEAAYVAKEMCTENIRYSPVWTKNFVEYHQGIIETVNRGIEEAKKLEDDTFKVYSSYGNVESVPLERPYSKCYFCEICPVISADQGVYMCHNLAYSKFGLIGSIKDITFSELWFSDATRQYMDKFDAKKNCSGHQCSSEARNLFIHEIIDNNRNPFI